MPEQSGGNSKSARCLTFQQGAQNKWKNISPALLDWFYKNHRILPFRTDPSPYHVWLSEIMLQQTRVSAALPYYERFLAALPDIRALAACEEEKLHKLWEGLGYYSRGAQPAKGCTHRL